MTFRLFENPYLTQLSILYCICPSFLKALIHMGYMVERMILVFPDILVCYHCPHCGGHCPGGPKILVTGLRLSQSLCKFVLHSCSACTLCKNILIALLSSALFE